MTDQPVNREPIFNIPRVIVAMLAVMAFIHAVRLFVLTPAQDNDLLWLFAFDPIALRRKLCRMAHCPAASARRSGPS